MFPSQLEVNSSRRGEIARGVRQGPSPRARELGVDIVLDATVDGVQPADGRWSVSWQNGAPDTREADAIVFAAGEFHNSSACGVRKVGSCGDAVFVDESAESVAAVKAGLDLVDSAEAWPGRGEVA